MAESDPGGSLAGGGEEDLRGRTMAVLLEEVVLDLPYVVKPQSVGQLHLVKGVLEELVLGSISPGPGDLVLVEQAELHDDDPTTGVPTGQGRGPGPRVAAWQQSDLVVPRSWCCLAFF